MAQYRKSKLELKAEQIITALDEYADEYDSYEFGLPQNARSQEDMKRIVMFILRPPKNNKHE